MEKQPEAAMAEFQTFLREEPLGPDTEAARKEMAVLDSTMSERVTAEGSAAPLITH